MIYSNIDLNKFISHISASATTYTVNSTLDTGLVNGVCDDGSGNCTLRDAILEANANLGTDTIEFDMSGLGSAPYTITPSTALPTITESLIIDGSTEPSANCDINGNHSLSVEIDGVTKGFNGFTFDVGENILKGLAINRFNNAVYFTDAGGSEVYCNLVGTDISGTSAKANNYGIRFFGTSGSLSTYIGSSDPADRNIISGNTFHGIYFNGSGTPGIVKGNYIGTDISGSFAIANNSVGIYAEYSAGNIIGGILPGEGNVISGNYQGVNLNGRNAPVSNSKINGNFIGVTADGTNPLGNNLRGIIINADANSSSQANNIEITGNVIGNTAVRPGIYTLGKFTNSKIKDNYIGTDTTLTQDFGNNEGGIYLKQSGPSSILPYARSNEISGNYIYYNDSFGLAIDGDAYDNNIISNNFYENDGLGIDQGMDGITLNDNEIDTITNFPVLSGFSTNGSNIYVFGKFNSFANKSFRLEFFGNDSLDTSSYGEGQKYLGYSIVQSNALGEVDFDISPISISSSDSPNYITSTATLCIDALCSDLDDTSEFSIGIEKYIQPTEVNSSGNLGDNVPGDGLCFTGYHNFEGDLECTLRAAVEESNTDSSPTNITFNIPESDINCLSFENNFDSKYDYTLPETGCLDGNADPDFKWWRINIGTTAGLKLDESGTLIDATTQPGYIENTNIAPNPINNQPVIEIQYEDNGGVDSVNGHFNIKSSDITIKGFVFNTIENVPTTGLGKAIYLNGNVDNSTIYENYFGTDISGNIKKQLSIAVEANCNTNNFIQIGGTNPNERNLFGGYDDSAIQIKGECNTDIIGNLLGTYRDAQTVELIDLNGETGSASGIYINSSSGTNNIGDGTIQGSNIISGSTFSAIKIDSSNIENNILNNIIGSDYTKTLNLGNGENGIKIINGDKNKISQNYINYNQEIGINLVGGTENTEGTTQNDIDDLDTGANNLQNYPIINFAINENTIIGYLNSTPNSDFTVEFFSNADDSVSTQQYLGSILLRTDSSGRATFNETLTSSFSTGSYIVATATDGNGNTSEISSNKIATQTSGSRPCTTCSSNSESEITPIITPTTTTEPTPIKGQSKPNPVKTIIPIGTPLPEITKKIQPTYTPKISQEIIEEPTSTIFVEEKIREDESKSENKFFLIPLVIMTLINIFYAIPWIHLKKNENQNWLVKNIILINSILFSIGAFYTIYSSIKSPGFFNLVILSIYIFQIAFIIFSKSKEYKIDM